MNRIIKNLKKDMRCRVIASNSQAWCTLIEAWPLARYNTYKEEEAYITIGHERKFPISLLFLNTVFIIKIFFLV